MPAESVRSPGGVNGGVGTAFSCLGGDRSPGGVLGGVLGGNGIIYAVPFYATSVLRLDPNTEQITTLGSLSGESWKWQGGVLAGNGIVYGMPSCADSVLRIDPATGEILVRGPNVFKGYLNQPEKTATAATPTFCAACSKP